jgi:putative hemolysin
MVLGRPAMTTMFVFLVIVLLIIANAFFVLSEMAIVSARKSRLQQLAEEGNTGAQIALNLSHTPNQFLPTTQLGMTLIGILAGAFGGIALAEPLAIRLKEIPTISPYSEFISFGLVVLGIAYLTLILGELVPKRLALSNPEKIASAVASYLGIFTRISSPFVFVLGASTDFAIWIMGIRSSTEPPLDEEEIKILIGQGTDAGVIEEAEQDIMERVFRLGDRRAGTLMTPRSEIVWLDIDDTPVVIQEKIAGQRYSLFPVCKDDIDNILGVVQAKDLLSCNLIDKQLSLKEALLPPLVVPDSMKALKVLERFKETGIHLALVLDEYGSVQGLITLADLLEALVGDIPHIDELKEPDTVEREDGSWLINGMLPIDDFKAIFEIDKLPNEDNGLYQTVGGFVMMHLERIPLTGDHFESSGLRFEVIDMDDNRVDKLLVVPLNKNQEKSIE